MRNASGLQGENGRQWKTSEQEQNETCNWEVSRRSNAKKMCAARAIFFFLQITPFLLLFFTDLVVLLFL